MDKKSKEILLIAGILFVVILLLTLFWKNIAPVIALLGFVIWLLHDWNKSKKLEFQQQQNNNLKQFYEAARDVVFHAVVKVSQIMPFQCPLTPQDIETAPPLVNISGIPVFEFKLVRNQATAASNSQTCARLQKLLQSRINADLAAKAVPNIPFIGWKDANGRVWPFFTILAIQDEPLYFIVQVVAVDSEDKARFLTSRKFGRHNPPPTPPSDPEF